MEDDYDNEAAPLSRPLVECEECGEPYEDDDTGLCDRCWYEDDNEGWDS